MISSSSYEMYKQWLGEFVDAYLSKVFPVTPETHPLAVLENIERERPSKKYKALEMAISDIVDLTSTINQAEVSALDAHMVGLNLPSLSIIRFRFWKRVAQAIKRQKISSDLEYYVLRSALDHDMPDEQRHVVERLVSEFELGIAAERDD